MALKITIFDGAIPMLDEIAKANYGQGLDALDHAGIKLRDSTRRAFRASVTPNSSYYKNGKFIFKVAPRSLGKRMSHKDKKSSNSPDNMESFITSNMMVENMTLVVAGKHKTLYPKIRRDGKVQKNAKKVGSVTKGSYAILQKLNSGDASDGEYGKVRRPKGTEFFENWKFKKHGFIEDGYTNARGAIQEIMTTKLESMIHKQINRATVKTKEVKTS